MLVTLVVVCVVWSVCTACLVGEEQMKAVRFQLNHLPARLFGVLPAVVVVAAGCWDTPTDAAVWVVCHQLLLPHASLWSLYASIAS